MIENSKIIVAMTSWPKRIKNTEKCILQLLNNTIKADKIYLTLSELEFNNRELPEFLIKFQEKYDNFEVFWVKDNQKTLKKVFPILDLYNSDDIFLTVDDDILYPADYIESRLKSFFICNQPLTGTNIFEPYTYNNWGVNGIFGAGGVFKKKMMNHYKEFINSEVIALYNDDIIYTVLSWLNGYIPQKVDKYPVQELITKYTYNEVFSAHTLKIYPEASVTIETIAKRVKEITGKNVKDSFNYYNGKTLNTIAFITNYSNNQLFIKFEDYYKERNIKFNAFTCKEYGYGRDMLEKIIPYYLNDNSIDLLCYIDVDCFVTDIPNMISLINYIKNSEYGICGMPDGGEISHRNSNPNYPNLFFVIFDLTKLRKVYKKDTIRDENIDKHINTQAIKTITKDYPRINIVKNDKMTPFSVLQGYNEPYYSFFAYFLNKGIKFAKLKGDDAPEVDGDGATTKLYDFNNNIIAYHTWFARSYQIEQYHTNRIDKTINYCNDLS